MSRTDIVIMMNDALMKVLPVGVNVSQRPDIDYGGDYRGL